MFLQFVYIFKKPMLSSPDNTWAHIVLYFFIVPGLETRASQTRQVLSELIGIHLWLHFTSYFEIVQIAQDRLKLSKYTRLNFQSGRGHKPVLLGLAPWFVLHWFAQGRLTQLYVLVCELLPSQVHCTHWWPWKKASEHGSGGREYVAISPGLLLGPRVPHPRSIHSARLTG